MIIELEANGAEKVEVRHDAERELKRFQWRKLKKITYHTVRRAEGGIRAVINGIQS